MSYNILFNKILNFLKTYLLSFIVISFLLMITQYLYSEDEIASEASKDSPKIVHNSEMKNVTLYNFGAHTNNISKYYLPLYADHKARRVGDIVTIIIYESSKASKSSATNTNEKSDANASLSELFGLTGLPLKMGTSNESGYTGSGTTTRSGSMEARISVTIKQILPNGNLLLEGTRQVTVNDDIQEIVLNGIVRPQDIRSDNTVISTYLAEAKIKYTGEGRSSQRPGIITRIIRTPFHWISNIFRKLI